MFCNAHYAVVELMASSDVSDATHRSQKNNRYYKLDGDLLYVWMDVYGWIGLMNEYSESEKPDLIQIGHPLIRYVGSSIDEKEVKYYESIETKNLYRFTDGDIELWLHGKWIGSSIEEFELEDKTLFHRKNLDT